MRSAGRCYRRHPGGLVPGEHVATASGRHAQRDVVAAGRATRAVVLVPGVVDRDLPLVVAGWQREGAVPLAVGGVEREVRRGAVRLPVAGTAELGLEITGHRHAV